MQLTDHLAALRRQWIPVVIMAALGLALALGASYLATPTYSAKSVVYFSIPNGTSGTDLQAGSTYAQAEVQSYAELATTHAVLEPVVRHDHVARSTSELAGKVSVEVVQGTVMVSVTATDPSASSAARISNAVAASLGKQVSALSPRGQKGDATVAARVVTKANPPTAPSSPHKTRNALAGLLGGLLIGVVLAILRDLTDTRVLRAEDVRDHIDAPIIGQIASRFSVQPGKLGAEYSSGAEAIRRVRTNLQFLGVEQRPLAVAVTSAIAGEGKSTVAVNLAQAEAEAGQRVLLVDGDLRRPAVGPMTGVDDAVGLTSVLIGDLDFDDAVQQWPGTGVDVLPAGVIPPNPGELLSSAGMERLLQQARGRYDVIVIDTAPLVPVVETAALANLISGYVLVARAGVVHSSDLAEAVAAVNNVGGRIFGVVMNDVHERHSARYGYAPKQDGPTTPSMTTNRTNDAAEDDSKPEDTGSKDSRYVSSSAARTTD